MISRRKFLLAGAGLPLLASCASDLTALRDRPPEVLAKELGVGAASYVALDAGKAGAAGDAFDLLPLNALERITVAQLLNHSSGFPNWSSGKLSFKSEPGERWGYSGEGYVVLQNVIEAVTQAELAAYLEQSMFAPLGMADSSLVWRDSFNDRSVGGSMLLGIQQRVRFQSAVAASTLYTTAADYARFLAAVLADDSLLAMTMSRTVEADKALGLAWGLGWGIEQGSGGPYIWQWGNNPGFRAFAMASTVSKKGFVVLTNSERGMPLAASIAHSVLPAEHNAFRFPWVA